MEEKKIVLGNYGSTVHLTTNGSIYYATQYIGPAEDARKAAHAILELIGDPVPAKGDDCYIAVMGRPDDWLVINECPTERTRSVKELEDLMFDGEYHIFRRVATVGPIPQPERKVTRYE